MEIDEFHGGLGFHLPVGGAAVNVVDPRLAAPRGEEHTNAWQQRRAYLGGDSLFEGEEEQEDGGDGVTALPCASIHLAIPENNLGFKMLLRMGWNVGKGLGRNEDGTLGSSSEFLLHTFAPGVSDAKSLLDCSCMLPSLIVGIIGWHPIMLAGLPCLLVHVSALLLVQRHCWAAAVHALACRHRRADQGRRGGRRTAGAGQAGAGQFLHLRRQRAAQAPGDGDSGDRGRHTQGEARGAMRASAH